MNDLDPILPLWLQLHREGVEYVLATVVEIEGSGYRKPGARMLVSADGRRAGTISGGCLEGEVARKAFWRTEDGPVVRAYSTQTDDGDVPFGMGCGGVIHLLLERSATAAPMMLRLAERFAARQPLAAATVIEGEREVMGGRAIFCAETGLELHVREGEPELAAACERMAKQAWDEQRSFLQTVNLAGGKTAKVRAEWNAARPGLFIFGAGDDAVPLVRQARQLGWYVAVADGRLNLATAARFAEANDVWVLGKARLQDFDLRSTDAAVVMTHSMEQDVRILEAMLDRELTYLGVLGPRRRTRELLAEIAGRRDVSEQDQQPQVEDWQGRLHAPMGLELGGDTPADIALSVMAEIQRSRYKASGAALKYLAPGTGRQVTLPSMTGPVAEAEGVASK